MASSRTGLRGLVLGLEDIGLALASEMVALKPSLP